MAAVQQLSACRPPNGPLAPSLPDGLAGPPPETSPGPPSDENKNKSDENNSDQNNSYQNNGDQNNGDKNKMEETAVMLTAETTVVEGPRPRAVAGTERSG